LKGQLAPGGRLIIPRGETLWGQELVRVRRSEALIEEKGFDFVAVEADWPDAAEIDAYVRHHPGDRPRRKPFQRFPRWMWANTDVVDFIHWLREHNECVGPGNRENMAGFHGIRGGGLELGRAHAGHGGAALAPPQLRAHGARIGRGELHPAPPQAVGPSGTFLTSIGLASVGCLPGLMVQTGYRGGWPRRRRCPERDVLRFSGEALATNAALLFATTVGGIMAITPYRPATDFPNALEAFFGPLTTSRMANVLRAPSADVVERENEIEVVMEIPGMQPEDIDIDLENNVLTVSGEKSEEHDEEEGTYHLSERRYGRFNRSFVLPRDVEPDGIRARCQDGLLTVTIPKSERARRRRIDVQRGDGGSREVEARTGEEREQD
jgi:HSP20 family protein